ncbi:MULTISPECIES: TauD/TfdA dioxygenase family protein [Pectobacterium]|uniref:TauD/TfdA dioxygenase family protein n=1 Tax=Pectobacterium parvum TaxID=2778550 RepID=A0AAP9LB74_9GAMM|nr:MULTISPECIES: TauD/TfdA family dioxygenase [Pectobacterium]KHS96372.1 dioxygenase [Pectobacterium parvum]QHQ22980.1 TauD/TfdA family dioxygenase [Pectobacterium parvum]GKW41836.1 alpha-ketoglutarate-dependent taurine dioxygenase [Pectobacterium carotovorum subsp. carotovorum]
MEFEHTELSLGFGLKVTGINVKSIDQSDAESLIRLVINHQVVVISGQQLTPEEQIIFCRKLGDIFPHPLKKNTCPWPEMTYVTNVQKNGEAQGYPGPGFPIWHSDMCYEKEPPRFTTFYAEKVPEQGGKTLFCNTLAACDDLPLALKEKLEDKQAIFGFSQKRMQRCQERGFMLTIEPEDQRPDTLHSVLRPHPETGRKSIYVNWTHTDAISGMTEEESQSCLSTVYAHCEKPDYIYAHQYKEGDLVIWDNGSTLHTGDGAVPAGQARIMRRVVIV